MWGKNLEHFNNPLFIHMPTQVFYTQTAEIHSSSSPSNAICLCYWLHENLFAFMHIQLSYEKNQHFNGTKLQNATSISHYYYVILSNIFQPLRTTVLLQFRYYLHSDRYNLNTAKMYGLFAITNHYQNRVGPKVNLIMYLKLLNVSVTDFDLLVFNVFFGSKLKPMYP